jgi:hypothetical protein
VSSIPGANTIFQGQQNKGRSNREIKRGHREEQGREDTHTEKRDTEERSKTQIKEEPNKQIQRGTRTAPRHNVRGSEYIVNRHCSDD